MMQHMSKIICKIRSVMAWLFLKRVNSERKQIITKILKILIAILSRVILAQDLIDLFRLKT